VQSTTGTITAYGQGGAGNTNGTQDSNSGIDIYGGGSKISSSQGAIALTGTGGNGTNTFNYGVEDAGGGTISSTGTGVGAATITINGTGGNADHDSSGVSLTSTKRFFWP
jgi:hypothetical protein